MDFFTFSNTTKTLSYRTEKKIAYNTFPVQPKVINILVGSHAIVNLQIRRRQPRHPLPKHIEHTARLQTAARIGVKEAH